MSFTQNSLHHLQTATFAGYGESGFGDVGASVGANFNVKRSGQNMMDGFFTPSQDDAGKPLELEVFGFDFDGPTGNGPAGGPTLGNTIETDIAPGDSGGPMFVDVNGQLRLAGVNTFGIGGFTFGVLSGGMNLSAYTSFLAPHTSTVTVGAFSDSWNLTSPVSISGYFSNAGETRLNGFELAVNGAGIANAGTIYVANSQLKVQNDWTNSGTLVLQHGSIRTGNGEGLFTNAFFISTGSSIDSNFNNAGTFELTDNTSITGNFTNAGWTNLTTFDLTVNGSLNANSGDGITTGVLVGSGTYTIAPTSGEATFTNDITSAAADGGNYDTRSITFNMESGMIDFEVLSTDMGSGAFSQLANGYAMGTLTLPNTLTFLRLLDDTVNQGGGTQEAIYVENLQLGIALTASNFDFNSSLKIYYNHIVGDGDVSFVGTLDGAERIIYFDNIIPMSGEEPPPSGVVPEPSTLALLLLGIPFLWWAWRREAKKLGVKI